jgi:hypothetical protein
MIPHDGCRGFAQGWLNEIYLTFILVTIGGGREAKSPFAKMGHVVMSLFVLVAIRFATVVFSACHTKPCCCQGRLGTNVRERNSRKDVFCQHVHRQPCIDADY